ncbi:hypothetical protein ACF3NV_10065 (plasmid) [Moraxella atlantae]|uniref:hypothetical protein n=1 Tax=Faucicola atlantae TaxID=34059 RepID=UPI003753C9B9
MDKYLKKSAKQLKQEMLEMTQALEKIREEKIKVYGEIFLGIVESIDDAKRAEAYIKILEANASKAQKKILADDIADLKELVGIDDKPSTKIAPSNSTNAENTKVVSPDNLLNDGKKVDEALNSDGLNVDADVNNF